VILRALVQAPGAAAAAADRLREAGVDEELAGRVDEALALPFDSAADLVCPHAHAWPELQRGKGRWGWQFDPRDMGRRPSADASARSPSELDLKSEGLPASLA
jgi:hypothetical protein